MPFDLQGRISAFFAVVAALALMSCGNNVRTPAEFEPSSGVIVCWPLNLPRELVKDLSENVTVHVLVQDSSAEKKQKTVFCNFRLKMQLFISIIKVP